MMIMLISRAVTVFEIYYDAVNGRAITRGGVHRVNMLPLLHMSILEV